MQTLLWGRCCRSQGFIWGRMEKASSSGKFGGPCCLLSDSGAHLVSQGHPLLLLPPGVTRHRQGWSPRPGLLPPAITTGVVELGDRRNYLSNPNNERLCNLENPGQTLPTTTALWEGLGWRYISELSQQCATASKGAKLFRQLLDKSKLFFTFIFFFSHQIEA